MYSSFQFQINKKESVIREFEMDFKKSFCCSDDIIYVLSYIYVNIQCCVL